jgi:tellurite resistance protein TerC
VLYIFGAILIYSGFQMAFGDEKEVHPEDNKVLKLFKRFYKVTHEYDSDHFFIKRDGVRYATPLFVCLIVIESTDLVFAVDSIPAIFAITTDPFIIFSSNILAVLGLRSIYFLLSAVADKFEFVKKGVGIILCYVGVKMLLPMLSPGLHIPVIYSLMVILTVLGISIAVSLYQNKRKSRVTD